MLIMIQKDAATQISKEVETLEDAQVFANNGFHVAVAQEDGSFKPLTDVLAEEPAEVEAAPAPKKPAAKKK